MRFPRRAVTRFVPCCILAAGVTACAFALSACAGPTPSPTILPMPTVVPTPTIRPTSIPAPEGFPELCDITHNYWLHTISYPGRRELWPSPDGRYVVSSQDAKVVLEEATTGKTQIVTDNRLDGVVWSPQSDQMILAEDANTQTGHSIISFYDYDLRQGMDAARRILLPFDGHTDLESARWSPDGSYLLSIAADRYADPKTASIWSMRDGKTIYQSHPLPYFVYISDSVWSPDSRWLAYPWTGRPDSQGEPLGYRLTIVDTATGDEITYPVVGSEGDISKEDIFNASLLWSPDSHGLALVFGQRVEVFRPGTAGPVRASDFPDMMAADSGWWRDPPRDSHFPFVSWQADSRALLVWSHSEHTPFRLDRLLIDPPGREPLMMAERRPFLAPSSINPAVVGRLAIYSGDQHHYRIDLMNSDGSWRVPLLADVADAGDPDWSPNGQTVAAVWTNETGPHRSVNLLWADAQSGQYHVLETDSVDIRNLSWSPDSEILTYIGVRDGEVYSVEMLNLRTGAHHVLLDDLKSVMYPKYDSASAYYTIRWQSLTGQVGYDGFDQQGSRVFRVLVDGDIASIKTFFFSPDRQMAAVKVRDSDKERLEVARTDGSPPITLRAGLSGLGDPLWSPDSRLLAFTQSIDYGPVGWSVIDIEGRELWTRQPIPGESYTLFWRLGWGPCPH